MPIQKFSSPTDVLYVKKRDAEKHRLYFLPRRWLVHGRDTTTINIYGEPGSPITGSDGVTSIPATREFTSVGSDFVTAGVQVSDILEVKKLHPCETLTSTQDDNERYQIETVTTTTLTVDTNWPVGSLDNLDFEVHLLKERYTEFSQLVPFNLKLNPTEKVLKIWGIDESRDALIELSTRVCDEIVLVPKIGDRFIVPYPRRTRNIHYEVRNLFEADQLSDSGDPLHYIGFCQRTTNRLP